MNSAMPLQNELGVDYPLTMQGAGRIDVPAAVEGNVIATAKRDDAAVGVSFGAIVTDEIWSGTEDVIVDNAGAEAVTYSVTAEQVLPLPGVTLDVEPSTLTVEPGQSAVVTLTLTLDPHELGAPGPDAATPATQFDLPRHWLDEAEGFVLFDDGDSQRPLRVPFHAVVRAASRVEALDPVGCSDGAQVETLSLTLGGESAHPTPVTSVFELGALLDKHDESDTDPATAMIDLRAVGVATDAATAQQEDVSLFFGLAVSGPWTTPAQGPYSLLGVEIDTDEDEEPDFVVIAEPLGNEPPFADVLAATTYVIDNCVVTGAFSNCEPTESKRYINMVPADQIRSYPYYNDVLVLAVFARDLGLGEQTTFRYRAYSQGLAGTFDLSPWIPYDYRAPRVDAAPFAPTEGRPIFAGDSEVKLALGEPDDDGAFGSVLLLHHTNAPGSRFETVALDSFTEVPTALRHDLPEVAAAGSVVTKRVYVDNPGDQTLQDVTLTGEVSGARLRLAAPDQGECADGELVDCTLGDVAPGQSVAVTLQLAAAPDASALDLQIEAASSSGCVTAQSASVELTSEAPPAALDVGGGCGCRLHGRQRQPRPEGWWLALLLPGLIWRRRSAAEPRLP
jgi:hypothetical protein